MKRIFYIILIFTTSIYSYDENTHQWLTIQSYYLLKKNLGLDINALNTHLHIDYSVDEGGAWQVPYITRGANLEDRIDPVYNYSFRNPPRMFGDAALEVELLSEVVISIADDFYDVPDWFVSTTHFWNPDLGDNQNSIMHAKTFFRDFFIFIPNAYKKCQAYVNGDYDLSVNLVLYGFPTNSDGSGSCATQRAIVTFRYNTLPGLYNTRQLYVTKVTWLTGEQTIYNSPILFTSNYWSSLNNSTHSNFIDCIIYETLGRMCHLLQDMSVPAHSKIDEHSSMSNGDSYESYMKNDRYWTSDLVNNLVGPMVNIENEINPLHFLMYTTAQMSQHYGSNGPYEGDGNNYILGNYSQSELNYLNNNNLSSLGNPTSVSNPIQENDVYNIRNKMIPQAIRTTAALLYWFAKECNLLPPTRYVSTSRLYENSLNPIPVLNQPALEGSTYLLNDINSIDGYNFSGWKENLSYNNPQSIIVPSDLSFTSIFKKLNYTDNIASANNNNQRRICKTPNGILHKVYESMSMVWYERSTDNGVTWNVVNSRPLSTKAKRPSIDNSDNDILLCFQENNAIKIKHFSCNYNNYIEQSELVNTNTSIYSNDASPIIVASKKLNNDIRFMLFYLNSVIGNDNYKGIVAHYGILNSSTLQLQWIGEPQIINGAFTRTNSLTAAVCENYNQMNFHVAWEQDNVIKYAIAKVNISYIPEITFPYQLSVSTGSGYSKNYKPMITSNWQTVNGISREIAQISWIGENEALVEEELLKTTLGPQLIKNVVYKNYYFDGVNHNWSPIYTFGTNVDYQSNNLADVNGIVIGWHEGNGNNRFIKNLNSISTINKNRVPIVGSYPQIINAEDLSLMRAFVVGTTSPYDFRISDQFSFELYKEAEFSEISLGRQGIIYKDSAQFYFTLVGVKTDTDTINFVELPDSINFLNIDDVNSYLESKPIVIGENSSINFGVQYGVEGIEYAKCILQEDKNVQFKLIAIDAFNNNIVGEYLNYTFNKDSLPSFGYANYSLNTQGLEGKTIKLKILLNDNLEGNYSIVHKFIDNIALPKTSIIELNSSHKKVTEYYLTQNYPNPFNPSTTISYSLPSKGFTSLKVYDILGNQIATLVDEYKPAGSYTIDFNASNLSSGVYFYSLTSGSFTMNKKMILMK
ncbi:MAG TPA: T9SS type A sorting domain-containing protein [Ignavibacteriaceae bacterium]|nr:T9SS type A sorting domain-containing protein [Ignavibacteriaceae bacterium]